jgi:predicted nucleic acid-binding Zn ribbon protein
MTRYHYWQERPCQVCGKSIKGKRGDAKYCSANCRKAASRHAERLQNQGKQIMRDIGGLTEYLADREHRYAAREILLTILGQVQQLLSVTAASGTHRGAAANVTPASVTDKNGQS